MFLSVCVSNTEGKDRGNGRRFTVNFKSWIWCITLGSFCFIRWDSSLVLLLFLSSYKRFLAVETGRVRAWKSFRVHLLWHAFEQCPLHKQVKHIYFPFSMFLRSSSGKSQCTMAHKTHNREVTISLRQRQRVRERIFCELTPSFIAFFLGSYSISL